MSRKDPTSSVHYKISLAPLRQGCGLYRKVMYGRTTQSFPSHPNAIATNVPADLKVKKELILFATTRAKGPWVNE